MIRRSADTSVDPGGEEDFPIFKLLGEHLLQNGLTGCFFELPVDADGDMEDVGLSAHHRLWPYPYEDDAGCWRKAPDSVFVPQGPADNFFVCVRDAFWCHETEPNHVKKGASRDNVTSV